ncbi:MAG: SpoIIE family protein phosphatase [Gemmatimonadaceae bacterium]|nr:SpoIIE family protein phosphatase [Gemmatimonadaceae bacterium]
MARGAERPPRRHRVLERGRVPAALPAGAHRAPAPRHHRARRDARHRDLRSARRLAGDRSLRRRRRRGARRLPALPAPRRHAVPAVGARGRARGRGAGRALRGDQSPLHDQRDPRPRGHARGDGGDDSRGGLGARRASILVHDRVTDTLNVVAALGVVAAAAPPLAVDDPNSVSARVFREQHLRIVEEGEMLCDAERPYRKGAMMSVPIMWTSPTGGSEPLGVVNLSGRHGDQPFTAGDQKLMAAIATQIGTAIQNARLVRSSLNQQKLLQEMQLAHDLQMKLLPRADVVAPEATVSARVIPAESVGGDFYNLFRLGEGRTGVMIGDVSSHGYRAALIMALTMSATAIHAQRTSDPAQTLDALLHSVRDELESTEMFVSVFYGVVDPAAERLRYSNTGHPHAFVIGANGSCERLPALDPPLGMVPDAPAAQERPWASGEDLLLLFTDGISDARGRDGERLGEQAVLETVLKHRAEEPSEIVEHVFEILRQHMGDTPRRDDLTLVVLRS